MKPIQHYIVCIGLVFLMPACTPPLENIATYEKLCEIYENVVQQPIEYGDKQGKLVEIIQQQLPEFYNKHFRHLITSDRDETYELSKQAVEFEVKREWECAVMKAYYDGDYDSPISE